MVLHLKEQQRGHDQWLIEGASAASRGESEWLGGGAARCKAWKQGLETSKNYKFNIVQPFT